MGSNNITQIGSFTVCSVDENGNKEFLGTLNGVESIEAVTNTEPEMTISLLKPDEATFTGKLTPWTRIKLQIWWWKLKIQKYWTYRKFKRSFDKAAKVQARYEKVLKGD